MSASEAALARPARRSFRPLLFALTITAILALLFGVPWWTLALAGAQWPAAAVAAATVVFGGALVAFPVLMYVGHGRRHRDWAAVAGDTLLGVIWILFVWALLGNVARLALGAAGVADPLRSRVVAGGVVAVSLLLALWGYVEAMRVPRVRRVDVALPRLAAGLDGVKVVVLTDTHYGPIDRARWSARVVEASTRSTPTSCATPATSPTARWRNGGTRPRRSVP